MHAATTAATPTTISAAVAITVATATPPAAFAAIKAAIHII
jgi:hypothetical protein